MQARRWYSGLIAIYTTIVRTAATLRHHRLGALIPVFGVLLLLAVLLWTINSIAPLAPFIYSLF
jgi:hypothetical protein